MKLTKSFLVETIPDIDKAIRASRGECVVMGMESDGIYRVNLLYSVFFNPVTFKGIFPLLDFWARVKILYCYSTLKEKQKMFLRINDINIQEVKEKQQKMFMY